MDLFKLGQILQEKRDDLKLSLRDASELIGISHNYLSILEKAKDPRSDAPIKPTIDTLKLICDAYNLNINTLLPLAGYTDITIKITSNINTNVEDDLTDEERKLLETITNDPELSILFHELKNAPAKKIKQLLKTWEFINEQFDDMEKKGDE